MADDSVRPSPTVSRKPLLAVGNCPFTAVQACVQTRESVAAWLFGPAGPRGAQRPAIEYPTTPTREWQSCLVTWPPGRSQSFSPALARASSMERNFYGHHHNRTRIARPRRPGSFGVLLPHRRLLELATASAQQPKHQHRNHNRGNGDSTNGELRRFRTFQAVNALEPRGGDRALHSCGNANAARR